MVRSLPVPSFTGTGASECFTSFDYLLDRFSVSRSRVFSAANSSLVRMPWYVLPDTHPEDIDQLERCALCYARLPEYKKIAWS